MSLVSAGTTVPSSITTFLSISDDWVIRGENWNTHNIAWYKFSSPDFLFLAIANNASLHCDVSLQAGDDIGSLLLLVPTDDSVEQQDTNDDTGINPVLKTKSEDCCSFHNLFVELASCVEPIRVKWVLT